MAQRVRADYWHAANDGRFVCDLCPRHCRLSPGQRGLCFVRAADEEGLYLDTYGRSSGFVIDPIEKKPLNHFHPGTSVLSFGTAGCNLTCKFCQNWDISKSREQDSLNASASPEAIATIARQRDCKSVAYTYNDPVIFAEYARDVAIACHDQGLYNVVVSAGYITPHARPDFFRHIDAANIDLKAFSESFYRKLCSAELDVVKETLVFLCHETDVWFEITDLVIPGENDSEDEIRAMCAWICETLRPDVPVHFTAFHPDYKMMDIPRTPPSTLARCRAIAFSEGLQHVYVGNVHDVNRQSSYCHHCGHRVIERDWHQLSRWSLTQQGACRRCLTPFPGRLNGPPGQWGRKRVPISPDTFSRFVPA